MDPIRRSASHSLVATCLCASQVAFAGGGNEQFFVVDFEDLAEGTEISTQYAAYGVSFSIEGDRSLLPIIAVEGSPAAAFTGSGQDNPMSSGSGGLTDPLIGGSPNVPNDIRMTFSPLVTSASFYVIDIESGETVVATAYDGDRKVASQTIVGGTAGTGNGKSTLVQFEADSITSILVDISGPANGTGWAIDFLSISRPCAEAGCAPRLRVSQESAPGAGDFASHILGEVPVVAAPLTPASAIYAYDVPEGDSFNGFLITPEADTSQLFVAQTLEGYTIFLVHDRAIPDDPDGGYAETRVTLLDDPDGGAIVVRDDPDSLELGDYEGDPGSSIFEARQNWDPCCTDGYAVAGLNCGGAAIVEFTDTNDSLATPTIGGLTGWIAVGADGSAIPLALEEDRRVLIQQLPPTNCPADLNCDGVVDAADLAILLGAWSPPGGTTASAADLDASGAVDATDLAILLGEWGPC